MRTLIFSALAVAAGIYAEKKYKVSDRITDLLCQSNNNQEDNVEDEDEDVEDFKAI